MKGAVDFDRGKVAGIKLEPMRIGQIGWIEISPPLIERPGACANTNLLLIGQIQMEEERNRNWPNVKDVDLSDCRSYLLTRPAGAFLAWST